MVEVTDHIVNDSAFLNNIPNIGIAFNDFYAINIKMDILKSMEL